MKKILFLMVIGFGGSMLFKNGYVTISPDNQVKVAGWAVPLPAAVQSSPVMGMVTTLLQGNLGPTGAPGKPGAAGANNPAAKASDQFSAVAKALH
jgi:hypothetical protein